MEYWLLKQRQNLPLKLKIELTKRRIIDWYNYWDGKVYISFSGGKDSTVLLNIARELYPEIPAVFIDTGLEFPEIRDFVKTIDNVTWLKPKMNFKKVIEQYGYPIISKDQARAISRYRNTKDPIQKYRRLNGWPNGKKGMISKKWQYMINAPFKISDRCCDIMKKNPLDKYAKENKSYPITGMMAIEGHGRKMQYLSQGCNAFNNKKPMSWPIAFWLEQDIWGYLKEYNIQYSKIYDIGHNRTGCMFCCFGIHMQKRPNRFDLMKITHPKQYSYCMNKLGIGKVLNFINNPTFPIYFNNLK